MELSFTEVIAIGFAVFAGIVIYFQAAKIAELEAEISECDMDLLVIRGRYKMLCEMLEEKPVDRVFSIPNIKYSEC